MSFSGLSTLFPLASRVWEATTPSPASSLLTRTVTVVARAIAFLVAFLVNIPLIPFIALRNCIYTQKAEVLEPHAAMPEPALPSPSVVQSSADQEPPVETLQLTIPAASINSLENGCAVRPVRDFLLREVDWKDLNTLREFNKLLSNSQESLQQDLQPLADGEVMMGLVAQLGCNKIGPIAKQILIRLLRQLQGQLHQTTLVGALSAIAKCHVYTDLILTILPSMRDSDWSDPIREKIWFELVESAAISLNLNQYLIAILDRKESKFSSKTLQGSLYIAIKCCNSGLVHQLIDTQLIEGFDQNLLKLLQDIRLYNLADSSAFQKAARYCTEAVLSQRDLGPYQQFLTFILQNISKNDAELSFRIVNTDVIDWTASNASKIISQMIVLHQSQKQDIAGELVQKTLEKASPHLPKKAIVSVCLSLIHAKQNSLAIELFKRRRDAIPAPDSPGEPPELMLLLSQSVWAQE